MSPRSSGRVNGPNRACQHTNRPMAGESGDGSGLGCRNNSSNRGQQGVAMEKNPTGAVSAATAPTSPEASIPEALGNHVCFLLGTVSTRAIELFGQELTGSKLSVRAAGMLLLLTLKAPRVRTSSGNKCAWNAARCRWPSTNSNATASSDAGEHPPTADKTNSNSPHGVAVRSRDPGRHRQDDRNAAPATGPRRATPARRAPARILQ